MNKYKKEGCVAVLYSPGYGAGWSTWDNGDYGLELIFDPTLVDMILNGIDKQAWTEYVTLKYPDMYLGGLDDLCIWWVKEGTQFQIREHDGSESVVEYDPKDWIVA